MISFCAHAQYRSNTMLRLQGFDLELRVITQRDDGMLQGIVTLNNIALRADEEKGRHHPELNYEDAMGTVKAICEHRLAHPAAA